MQGGPIEELVDGVRLVDRGRRYLSPALALRMVDGLSRDRLTSRETDVLDRLSQGACNKSIARDLGIAVGTVKVHVKGILEKLGASSRTHAVIVAAERGLMPRSSPTMRHAATASR